MQNAIHRQGWEPLLGKEHSFTDRFPKNDAIIPKKYQTLKLLERSIIKEYGIKDNMLKKPAVIFATCIYNIFTYIFIHVFYFQIIFH